MEIYVLSRPHFEQETFRSFLQDVETSWQATSEANEAENIVEVAGRVCYMSFGEQQSPRTNSEYIRNLIAMGHESVLEHVNWTFLITGVSRAFTHQLVRHRTGFAFSQLSQQYHDEVDATFVEPGQLHRFPQALKAWQEAMKVARNSYREILDTLEKDEATLLGGLSQKEARRAIRSAARSVLPNATETKIIVTANARALRHFLDVRGSIPGDEEMRCLSYKLLQALKNDAPAIFCDFRIETLSDGSPIVIKADSIANNQ